MSDLVTAEELFFAKPGLDRGRVVEIVEDALTGTDDGELFLEYCQSESLVVDDGQLKNASFDTVQGFGLRGVAGEASGYAHASVLDEDAIRRAAETVGGGRAERGIAPRRAHRLAGPGGTAPGLPEAKLAALSKASVFAA